MAANSWNSLVGSVNQAISSMGTATSSANGAAAAATEARETAEKNAALAQTAAQNAQDAANSADAERAKWTGAVASATTLDPEAEATFSITEKDGVKNFAMGIPRGKPGKDGEKGEPGKSGVTFTLSGTVLYIERA